MTRLRNASTRPQMDPKTYSLLITFASTLAHRKPLSCKPTTHSSLNTNKSMSHSAPPTMPTNATLVPLAHQA
ncbi:hypothetical protein K439DRAFT_889884 [Ramaria rubella]|nr:hypothetical protein K439DRAFT_889884 [Ramaria rubella]